MDPVTRYLTARALSRLMAFAVFLAGALPFSADGAELGSGELTTEQRGITLSVFTYGPRGCLPRGVLLVFHGNSRNADDYRDYARPFADKFCLSVYAPRFDRERFRLWRYHHGGVIRRNVVQPPDEWTVSIIQDLARWALTLVCCPKQNGDYVVLGSADRVRWIFSTISSTVFVQTKGCGLSL